MRDLLAHLGDLGAHGLLEAWLDARVIGRVVEEDIDRTVCQRQRDLEAHVAWNYAFLAQRLENEIGGEGVLGIAKAPSRLPEPDLLDAGFDPELPELFTHRRLPLLDALGIARRALHGLDIRVAVEDAIGQHVDPPDPL